MSARVFFSTGSLSPESSDFPSLLREAARLLFPAARSFQGPEGSLGFPHSFFLQEGENIIWVEHVSLPFSRDEISNYLLKTRQIQSILPLGISGILVAPRFESGVQELLELVRIPIRIFRYHVALPLGLPDRSLHESALWIEELTVRPPDKNPSPTPAEYPASSWNRLTREELREFIQLELEVAQIA